MRVIYDCTIILESETVEYEPTRQLLAGHRYPSLATLPSANSIHYDIGRQGSLTDIRQALHEDTRSLRRRSNLSALSSADSEDEEVARGLHDMLVEDEDQDEGEITMTDHDDLPDDIRTAIDRIVEGASADLPGDIQLIATSESPDGGYVELVRSRTTDQIFEITTTTTTTETKTVVRIGAPGHADQRVVAQRSQPGLGRTRSVRDLTATLSHGESVETGVNGEERTVEDMLEEAEWVEVESLLRDTRGEAPSAEELPEASNGQSVAAISRFDTLSHPEEGRQRLTVVLKTVTQRLTHRKQVFRRLRPETPTHRDVREIEWEQPLQTVQASPVASPSKRPGAVKRNLLAAKPKRTNSTSLIMGPSASAPRSSAPATPCGAAMASSASAHASSSASPPPLRPPSPTLRRPKSATSMRSVFTTHQHLETSLQAPEDSEPKPNNFPHAHLVANLRRFMRYSSAACACPTTLQQNRLICAQMGRRLCA
jgi:hypothetical protein